MAETSSRLIGRRVKPDKSSRFITGNGMYVGDIRLPNMLQAAVLRSVQAHARISAIDVKEALALDGVVGVWTGREIEGVISPFPESFEIHPARWLEGVKPLLQGPRPTALAQAKVHYVGEPVAIVLAEDRAKAEDAVDAVVVEYEELPVVVDPEESLQSGATLVHEGSNNNVVFSFSIGKGNVEQALAGAPHRLSERYRHHRYCAAPLECRGVAAWVEPKTNVLTVWSSTQMPHLVRRQIAAQLHLAEERVRVIAPDIGGGFGPKVFVYPEEILIPFLALQLGRPVKWIEDRTEHFISTAHGRDQLHDVEMAFDEAGRILGLSDRFLLDNGAYNPMGLTDAYNTAAHLQGPYKIPNLSVTGTCVSTNKVPNAPYRGAGRPEAVFAMERCIDTIAARLRLDPAEVRRRILLSRKRCPIALESCTAMVSRSVTTAAIFLKHWSGHSRPRITINAVSGNRSCAKADATSASASVVTSREPASALSRAQNCALTRRAKSSSPRAPPAMARVTKPSMRKSPLTCGK
jgi:aerobic carbon-monoxide dehydrogenase large subunit